MPENVKYINAGYKRRRPDIASPTEDTETTVYKTLQLNDKQFPFMAGKNKGDMVEICIKCHITGVREAEDWDDIKKADYFDMEIQKVAEYK